VSVITVTSIPAHYAGPPFAANGGYVAGVLAEHLGVRAAHVELLSPIPLATPIQVAVSHAAGMVVDSGALAATARPVSLVDSPRPRVGLAAAARAALGVDGAVHPFPQCFVCGPARRQGDGLHLYPGRVDDGVVAVPWRPGPEEADAAGTIPVRIVAAALDCPSGFASLAPGETALLASLDFEVMRRPNVGEQLVVTGWERSRRGRKMHTASAVETTGGEIIARAYALWIQVGADRLSELAERMAERAA
jgi:hypothetical protein